MARGLGMLNGPRAVIFSASVRNRGAGLSVDLSHEMINEYR